MATLYFETGQYTKCDTLLSEAHALQQQRLIKSVAHLSEKELFDYTITFQKDLEKSLSYAAFRTKPAIQLASINYDNQLFYKGFLLHSAISVKNRALSDTVTAEQWHYFTAYRRRYDEEFSKPIGKRDSAVIQNLAKKINEIEKNLAQQVKGFGEALKNVTWQQVSNNLKTNEVAIEFTRFRYHDGHRETDSILYGALVLRPGFEGSRQPHFIPLFEEKQLAALFENRGLAVKEWLGKAYPARSPKSSELYRLIWQPLEPYLVGVRRIWYAPSGLLYRVAFPAISKAQGERLLEKYDLQQVGSTRELAIASSLSEGTPQSALILACVSYPTDTSKMHNRTRECLSYLEMEGSKGSGGKLEPLPNSLPEADTVAVQLQAAGAQVEIRIGYEALEDDAKERLAYGTSPDVLMFTTHGFAWDTLPQAFKGHFPSHNLMYSSGLLLAGAGQVWMGGQAAPGFQDGILTAREISDLNLQHTRLVILSACDSGLGPANGSEGVYGLQRAFKLAGARQVLATLWEIPDSPETQEFVGQFCYRWLKSGDARISLRETQLDFFRRGKSVQVWGAWALI